ncbi:MAG: ATP-binding protein [Elusimicrobiaceae bacterium]|nr:ATP-binding protein [Elusimicrobiaceae bacterium]
MQLLINQIGKIQQASVNINGLTAITGKNDTGKSTIGKLLYAIFRALNIYPSLYEEAEKDKLLANAVLPLFRQYIALPLHDVTLKREIINLLDTRFISTKSNELYKLQQLSLEQISTLTNAIENHFSNGTKVPVALRAPIQRIKEQIDKIHKASVSDKMRHTLWRTLNVMFSTTILNSKHHQNGNFSILNENHDVLQAHISSNNIQIQMDEILVKGIPQNVIYLESPFILEEIICNKKPHWSELSARLHNAGKSTSWGNESVNQDLLDFIQKNILGNAIISFDESKQDFVYQADVSSDKLNMTNVACGIKSFALIFLLLKLNILTKDSILVIDEPENHLHPEFQIKYAEMISLLVSQEFYVVLVSHSPTFIQALGAYSRKYKIQDKSSFYLANAVETSNYSNLADVTSNLSQIYQNLAAPVEKLFLGV